MEDNYTIDLKAITLADYEKELEEAELLPSRKILKDDIHQRFNCLRAHGQETLHDLLEALKTPQKIEAFAQKTGISQEYLVILKREISSNQPKPVKLGDFPAIPAEAIEQLAHLGIHDTRQLFQYVKTENERRLLSEKTGVPQEIILELTRLTDVSRIRWVGANFARLLVDSDCDTVEKVTGADYVKLYADLMRINEEKKYFKGKFGLNDMKLCVLAAKVVPRAIEYTSR